MTQPLIEVEEMTVEADLLPNLLIIGAAKSGTSALHKYLGEHPEIFMSEPKEPRFFLVWNNPEQMAINEKENHFVFNRYNTIEKYQQLFVNGRGCAIRGESSPQYLTYAHCAGKIKKLIPNAKIIVVLRNPVDRAFSHYVMYRNWRVEEKSFEAAIDEELKTGRVSCIKDMRYLHIGKYVGQLKPYLELFSPDQLRTYLFDDLKNDTKGVVKDIFSFLDVDQSFSPKDLSEFNVSAIRRYAGFPRIDKLLYRAQRGFRKFQIHALEKSVRQHRLYKPVFKKQTREKIVRYYANEISELEKMLDKDLSKWRD